MADTGEGDQDRYIHLKEISVDFVKKRPTSVVELVFKDHAGVRHKSNNFKKGDLVHWNIDIYVCTHASATFTIRRSLFKINIAEISVEFEPNEFGDDRVVGLADSHHRVIVNFVYGRSNSSDVVTPVLSSRACTSLASNVLTFWNFPELAAPSIPPPIPERFGGSRSCTSLASIISTFWDLAQLPEAAPTLPPPTSGRGSQSCASLASSVPSSLNSPQLTASSLPPPIPERGYDVPYAIINRLNDDILLDIFTCYRLDDEFRWNDRFGWLKLSQVCQRWRHLIYESTFYLGMQIRCTPGACIENTPNHLPSMPLHVEYVYGSQLMTKQDELGLYQALQLHDRLFHISLHLPPSILHKCFVLMDKHFPILKCLCLRVLSTADDITTFALPKAFLAPNLRYLALPGISTPRRLRVLTSTVSLVTLVLTNIQTSGYFRPRILVARLWFLPRLEDLSISFSVHIPHPIAERELFQGVDTYLECLLAQIRTPLLERLQITLFYQRAFALPHLSYLINITEVFKLHQAIVYFGRDEVSIATYHHNLRWSDGPFSLSVGCKRLNWQVDCAAQIFSGFISVLSSVEKLTFYLYNKTPSAEWGNGEIDRTKWHDLLRSFTGVKQIRFCDGLSKELSPALQFNEVVGSDPRFLPNLQNILAPYNMFTSFINARQVSGRPVQLYHW